MHRALLSFALGATAVAQGNLVQNGSFETGPNIPPGQTSVTVSGTQLPGWVIPFGNVDINGPAWNPPDGVRSVDLHGTEVGALEQAISTVPAQSYLVLFDLGATGQTASIQITAAGQTSPVFQQVGATFPSVVYTTDMNWTFTAVATTTTLHFDSLSTASVANGPHLDNVRVFASAAFTPFGAGCQGSNGVPGLAAATGSLPQLGQTFILRISNLPLIFTVVIPFLGFDIITSGGVPLPRSLGFLGMPSCDQLVDPFLNAVLLTPSGTADWPINLPNMPAYAGMQIHFQALVVDPPANPFGATVTNGGTATIGP